MDARTVLIVGGAVALPSLVAGFGARAGIANTSAAAALPASVAGVTYTIPAGANMTDAWRAMRSALGARELSVGHLTQVCDAWLGAYRAGADADPVNYSLLSQVLDFGELTGRAAVTDIGAACVAEYKPFLSRIGRAVCALDQSRESLSNGWAQFADTEEVFGQVAGLAAAMDAADFARAGERRSDQRPAGLLDVPGAVAGAVGGAVAKVAGNAVGAVFGSPTFLALVVGGVILWRVAR